MSRLYSIFSQLAQLFLRTESELSVAFFAAKFASGQAIFRQVRSRMKHIRSKTELSHHEAVNRFVPKQDYEEVINYFQNRTGPLPKK